MTCLPAVCQQPAAASAHRATSRGSARFFSFRVGPGEDLALAIDADIGFDSIGVDFIGFSAFPRLVVFDSFVLVSPELVSVFLRDTAQQSHKDTTLCSTLNLSRAFD